MLLREYECFQYNRFMQIKNGQEYVLIYLKSTKSTKFLTCLKSVRSVI